MMEMLDINLILKPLSLDLIFQGRSLTRYLSAGSIAAAPPV